MPSLRFLSLVLALLPSAVSAQGTKADYERAAGLQRMAQGKVLNARPRLHWLGDGHRFIYLKQLPKNEKEILLVDCRDSARQPAFDHEKLASVLKEELKREINPKQMPFDDIDVNDEGTVFYFRIGTTEWKFDKESSKLEKGSNPRPTTPTAGRRPGGQR